MSKMSQAEIAAIVVGSITAIGVFVGPILAGRLQENSRKQKEALRNHFEKLKEGVLEPLYMLMANLENKRGELEPTTGDIPILEAKANYLTENTDFEQEKIYASFKLHFPSEASAFERFRNKFIIHNRNLTDFNNELRRLITKNTLLSFQSGGSRFFVFNSAIDFVRLTLYEIAKNEPISHDFSKVIIRREENIWKVKHPKLDAVFYAITETKIVAENFKSNLIELMDRKDLQERELQIIDSALQLENDAKEIAENLDFIIQKYSRFGSMLKKLEGCNICRIIPGKSIRKLLLKSS